MLEQKTTPNSRSKCCSVTLNLWELSVKCADHLSAFCLLRTCNGTIVEITAPIKKVWMLTVSVFLLPTYRSVQNTTTVYLTDFAGPMA